MTSWVCHFENANYSYLRDKGTALQVTLVTKVADKDSVAAYYLGPGGRYPDGPQALNGTTVTQLRNMVFVNVALFM